jgi:carbon storage regulator
MFILLRKPGQSIQIGDDIEITLVEIQLGQDQARLGITAPRSIGVYRKEVLQAIRRENRRAAAAPTDLPQLPTTPPESPSAPTE